jgi:hypothetical protein
MRLTAPVKVILLNIQSIALLTVMLRILSILWLILFCLLFQLVVLFGGILEPLQDIVHGLLGCLDFVVDVAYLLLQLVGGCCQVVLDCAFPDRVVFDNLGGLHGAVGVPLEF